MSFFAVFKLKNVKIIKILSYKKDCDSVCYCLKMSLILIHLKLKLSKKRATFFLKANLIDFQALSAFVLFFVLTTTFTETLWARSALIPGGVPIRKATLPAGDLEYQGRPINSQQVNYLEKQGVNPADLNPYPSEIWNSQRFLDESQLEEVKEAQVIDTQDKMGLSSEEENFEFIDFLPTSFGQMRFNVRSTRTNETFMIVLGPQVHKRLLRKAILRKLGYHVPASLHLKTYNVKFKGPTIIDQILNGTKISFEAPSIVIQTTRSPQRWITNIKKNKSAENSSGKEIDQRLSWSINNPEDRKNNILRLQDAVIYKTSKRIYDLSIGIITKSMIKNNRRVFNATIAPLALVQLNESLNLFEWNIGRIFNEQITFHKLDNYFDPTIEIKEEDWNKFESNSNTFFNTSLEDLIWISKRILKLSRKDFYEIAAQSHLPKEAVLLLTEKLISRRNSLRKMLNLDKYEDIPEFYKKLYHETQHIEVNFKISYGSYLKEGKLEKKDWEGYGSKLSFGEPEAILSQKELLDYGKVTVLSQTMMNLMSRANKELFPLISDTIQKKAVETKTKLIQKNFSHFLKTGEMQKVPFGFWTAPYASANLIVSRNVVFGSYFGSDNRIQMADTVGMAGQVGLFTGFYGLPGSVFANTVTQGQLVRTYTRLKVISNMEKALKEPFKNPTLPFILNANLPKIFKNFLNQQESIDQQKEQQKLLNAFMLSLTKHLSIGESLIITDRIVGTGSGTAGYQFDSSLSFQARLSTNAIILKRLHILRSNKSTIQIYDDSGHGVDFSVSSGLFEGSLPILSFEFKKSTGEAHTNFYNININSNLKHNPQIIQNLRLLQSVLFDKNLSALKETHSPYKLKHDFKQSTSKINLLVWERKSLNSTNSITIESPSGQSSDYIRSINGSRSGTDFQSFALNGLNEFFSRNSNSDISFAIQTSGDPGDTMFGNSSYIKVIFDARIKNLENDNTPKMKEPFSRLQYRWKGWEISKKSALNIINKINGMLNNKLFNNFTLNNTKEIQFYTIDLNVSFYESALDIILNIPQKNIIDIYEKEGIVKKHHVCSEKNKDDCSWEIEKARRDKGRKFKKLLKKYSSAKKSLNFSEAITHGSKALYYLANTLSLDAIISLSGGEKNVYIDSHISGFRVGDDAGKSAVFSSSIGRIGSEQINGPIEYLRKNIGMTYGEFFIQWMVDKL